MNTMPLLMWNSLHKKGAFSVLLTVAEHPLNDSGLEGPLADNFCWKERVYRS